ncbi:MAG: DUF4870 domain-containing protein [Candidatus Altiarchaeales archaeon]|nr:DUF4870 domain-containing protein [Candidatus Altiarchaeales archaeon]
MTNGNIGGDNLLGAYCHVPVIGGLLVPLIVYFLKGKENKELGFQAKQALAYQIIVTAISIGGMIAILMLSVMIAMGAGDMGGLLAMVLWLAYAVLMLAFIILSIMAAWKTYNKVSYEYPVIGKKLR